jgi:hypothetical protein
MHILAPNPNLFASESILINYIEEEALLEIVGVGG